MQASTTYQFTHAHPIQFTEHLFFDCKGAWWEVDLREDYDVVRVKIFNRYEGSASHIATVSDRLSNAAVSLRNTEGSTLKTCTIGSALNIAEFDINFDY
jgi:hypothetical protein